MLTKGKTDKKQTQPMVAVGIDKDKGSQYALKYASDNLLTKGQTIILIHVVKSSSSSSSSSRSNMITPTMSVCARPDPPTKELFLPFRIFCTRKDIQCIDIVLEDTDVARALAEYVAFASIEVLVVGASGKGGFLRFKTTDIPATVSKTVPDFCSVYVISKGKIASMKSSSRPAPAMSPMRAQVLSLSSSIEDSPKSQYNQPHGYAPSPAPRGAEKPPMEPNRTPNNDFFRSPFSRKGPDGRQYKEPPMPDTDISYVSAARPSIDDRLFQVAGDFDRPPGGHISVSSDIESFNTVYDGPVYGRRSLDIFAHNEFLNDSNNENLSTASQSMEEVEAEMRRLKMELKQTMEMYSTACKEALSAKEMTRELQRWKLEEERRLEEARQAEEAAMEMVQREKAKSRAAMEAAEAARRIAELESQKRLNAEMKAMKESDERKQVLEKMTCSDIRYRKYTIEEIEAATNFFTESQKIGEGGYGPVYRGFLDHTPVAIKVLRPDAAQGKSQFQQEVEVLSCIRHPNMVLLLGACPEYGCLVYEFMAKGSLEDCLFQLGNTPPLSWQVRFRIAAEIGTGLLFLHQTKPEPLVHRDLKPGNILLDRNFVSKISDVGLARLVPPLVAENVTQYRMTSTAGTFCYIDPEYQQTGMLGVKSDVYSLGIMFLQIVTGRPPMGLTHHVEDAIERGRLEDVLDPAVPDWPLEEAMCFARMSLQCAELRRKDRPDLGNVVLPELERLREIAEGSMQPMYGGLCSFGNDSAASLGSKSVRENIGSSGKTSSGSTGSSGMSIGFLTRSRASLSNRSLAIQASDA